MGLFTRLLRRKSGSDVAVADDGASTGRGARERTLTHLRDFVRTRAGAEAYLEPPTANDPVTILLIASTGEWTRRRVPDIRAGFALAEELGIPAYDVLRTGYPPRMRRWNSQNRHR